MISISNLHYQYGSSRKILNGLNLRLAAGKIYGILGRNGAGKSTILKCISGLLIPNVGQVKIEQWVAKDRAPDFLAQLFFLPEEFSSPAVHPEEYGKVYGRFYPRYDHTLFKSLCAEFEIPLAHRLDEMSYGQKKKTLIAFGIACNPKVIILDEPTNGLDIPSKSQFRKVISKSITADNCILISTHQIRDIEHLVDYVLIMNEGHVLFNQSYQAIAGTLFFAERETKVASPTRLYDEETIHGYNVIEIKSGAPESKIDLEMLYKAVMHNPQALSHPFN